MRPLGSYGDVARALLGAAEEGCAPVRELAERALIGYGAAAYTASRLVDRGHLVVVEQGRPAVLGLPCSMRLAADELQPLDALSDISAAWVREGDAEAWAAL